MKITLLRHGTPDVDYHLKLAPAELSHWLAQYDEAGVNPSIKPPKETVKAVRECKFIVCSDLRRSLESASMLDFFSVDISDSLFREFELPNIDLRYPKLEALTWTVVLRMAWLAGYSDGAESFGEAKKRATVCARRLIEYADAHQSVLFVGHGSLIWYITKILLKEGWRGPAKSPKKHWACETYLHGSTPDRKFNSHPAEDTQVYNKMS